MRTRQVFNLKELTNMSDVSPPTPPEQPPTPPAAPQPTPQAAPPPAAPQYATAPAAAGPKQGLSLTSFILGLAALVFSWALGFGFLLAAAAVVLGFLGKSKEPQAPKWMWLVGIITGFVAVFIAIIVLIFWIALFATSGAFINQYPSLY